MKTLVLVTVVLLVLCGCSSKTAPASSSASVGADKPKIYSMDDVNQELKDAGVQLGSTQEDAESFFKAHPNYQVCQDNEGGLIAVMRNQRADPKSDDQYIVVAYREGKVAGLDIGPPQFSAGNIAAYCH